MHNWSWLGFDAAPLHLKKGEILFRQGDAIDHMYYLLSGRVKLMRHTREGDSVILHLGTAGEMVAEASLFSDTYHCTAIVDQASDIQSVKRDLALKKIFNAPENSRKVLKTFSSQIRDLRGLIEIRNIRSAQSRILAYLNSIAETDGKVILHTSLRDIAYKLGLAHETLYRELRLLEEAGLIERNEMGMIHLRQ